jgi:hypothetical protein
MNLNEILTFVFNNGLAVVLIFYYLKYNDKTNKDLIKSNSILINKVDELIITNRNNTDRLHDILSREE